MKSYKRLISLVLLVFILATGSLNTSAAQLVRTKLDQVNILATDITVSASNKEELKYAIQQYVDEFTEDFQVIYTGQEIRTLVGDIFQELWNSGYYQYGNISKFQYSWKGNNGSVTVDFNIEYNHTYEQELNLDKQVKEILSQITRIDSTDLDKVKAVNDYIIENVKYSDSNPSGVSVQSPISLLEGNQGVCQAYALLTYKMLDQLGINVKYVLGYAGEEYHAWNLVQLNNQWYHLDTTWNDPVPDQGKVSNYSYFLKSDNQISTDHTWERSNYPAATDDRYEYLHKAQYAKTYGEYIYYINSVNDSNYKLYRTKIDGSDNKAVTIDNVESFAIYKNTIYYSNYSNGGYFSSSDLYGKAVTTLKRVHVTNINEDKGTIYYQNESNGRLEQLVIDEPVKEPIEAIEQPSQWAKDDVKKAVEYGLVDSTLLSSYKKNITREEFCDLVINIYDALSEKPAVVPISNVFIDTSNIEVLKAYELRVVNGVSATHFNPKDDINREQIAVMYNNLLSALKIYPMLTQEYVFFKDENDISSWAKNAVQTMNKLDILKGTDGSIISPKNDATREQAISLAVRLYEKYK